MLQILSKKRAATAMLAAMSLMLTGCFLSPGKFTSELVLERNNQFSFNYKGEIFFLGLSKLTKMIASMDRPEFQEEECYDNDWEIVACTAADIAEQRREWEANAESRAANKDKQSEQIAALMGGLDPYDPASADELAQRLQRQHGWNSVQHVGDGVYNVDFSISGTLSHDIIFPLIEKFPIPTQFVQVIRRDGNQVRVEAPGFAAQDNSSPASGMMGGIAGLAAIGAATDADTDIPNIPQMEGTFTIVTDGQILANNTDEGPSQSTSGQTLTWEVSKRTKTAPTALIKLGD